MIDPNRVNKKNTHIAQNTTPHTQKSLPSLLYSSSNALIDVPPLVPGPNTRLPRCARIRRWKMAKSNARTRRKISLARLWTRLRASCSGTWPGSAERSNWTCLLARLTTHIYLPAYDSPTPPVRWPAVRRGRKLISGESHIPDNSTSTQRNPMDYGWRKKKS